MEIFWKTRRRTLDLTNRGLVVGILNVTPDSFSDGGKFLSHESALKRALEMAAQGADIIDIGGESTRPGASHVSEAEERERVIPVIKVLRQSSDVLISIDSMKSSVAAAAMEAGADIINDVSGLGNPAMRRVVAESGAGAVIMHMLGSPRTMQSNPVYSNVCREVKGFLLTRMKEAMEAGIDERQIALDPGIGFGKTLEHNLTLIRNLEMLTTGTRPIVLGVSRKSFLGTLVGEKDPERRDWGAVALTSFGREKGVRVFRVHEPKANAEALRMTEAILGNAAH